jgi:hypothetical protein
MELLSVSQWRLFPRTGVTGSSERHVTAFGFFVFLEMLNCTSLNAVINIVAFALRYRFLPGDLQRRAVCLRPLIDHKGCSTPTPNPPHFERDARRRTSHCAQAQRCCCMTCFRKPADDVEGQQFDGKCSMIFSSVHRDAWNTFASFVGLTF